MFVLGIAGGTGSGRTTVAERLVGTGRTSGVSGDVVVERPTACSRRAPTRTWAASHRRRTSSSGGTPTRAASWNTARRWEDIAEERGIIRIRRGNWRTLGSTAKIDRRRRNPALTDELRQVLTEWRDELNRSHRHADSGWIFSSRAGKPYHNTSADKKNKRSFG